MRATIVVELEEEKARAYLAELWAEGDPDEEPPPEPLEWFRLRVTELVEDELAVATMYGPRMVLSVGEVER